MRIAIEFVNASHDNRSLGSEQLDDGIVDTLVLLNRICSAGLDIWARRGASLCKRIWGAVEYPVG